MLEAGAHEQMDIKLGRLVCSTESKMREVDDCTGWQRPKGSHNDHFPWPILRIACSMLRGYLRSFIEIFHGSSERTRADRGELFGPWVWELQSFAPRAGVRLAPPRRTDHQRERADSPLRGCVRRRRGTNRTKRELGSDKTRP